MIMSRMKALLMGCLVTVAACDTQMRDDAPQTVGAALTRLVAGERTPPPPTRPGGLTLGNDGPQAITCDSIDGVGSWCTCQGEGSPDCDLLFDACDISGGEWKCASDIGSDDDVCTCMDW